jgi:chemotaxis family two-component system response regulator Rcp1
MTPHPSPQPIEILLVEDNPGDVELTQEAFLEAKIPYHLHVVYDGDEALEYLYKQGRHEKAIRPDLVLLDLNMPGKDGKEVLAIIKEDAGLKDIPVNILTSSEAEMDIVKSYALHANAYIVKPANLLQFLEVIEGVESFWLSIVKLPPRKKKRMQ